jgi:triosephosphate isomerase
VDDVDNVDRYSFSCVTDFVLVTNVVTYNFNIVQIDHINQRRKKKKTATSKIDEHINTNMYMYVCIDCKKTMRKSEQREEEKKMKATASLRLFTSTTTSLLVPPLLSFFGRRNTFSPLRVR